MREYLLWGEVQAQLTRHLEETGTPYSFFDAVKELAEQGATHEAEELPVIPPAAWDLAGTAEFGPHFDQLAVDMGIFRNNLAAERDAVESSERIVGPDAIPGRPAWDQVMGLHTHDAFEVDYLIYGGGSLRLEDGEVPMTTGSFCIIGSRLPHDITVDRGGQMVGLILSEYTVKNTLFKILQYESALSDFFRRGLERDQRFLMFQMPINQWVRVLLGGLFKSHREGKPYSNVICADLAELLFVELLRSQDEEGQERQRDGKKGVPMVAVLQHLQRSYLTTSLAETAALFHYEPNYLSKQIKLHTGKTYTEIIRFLRLERAKRLLRETALPIREVAEKSGFESLVHFSRSFRGEEGLSPSAYRARGDQP